MKLCDQERLQREANRRHTLLGPLAMSSYSYQLLRERSRETWVPAKVLWSWWHAYQQQGLDGLLPSD
jgi:hypothetical protein